MKTLLVVQTDHDNSRKCRKTALLTGGNCRGKFPLGILPQQSSGYVYFSSFLSVCFISALGPIQASKAFGYAFGNIILIFLKNVAVSLQA